MITVKELKKQAKDGLKGKWGVAIGAMLIVNVLGGVASSTIGSIVSIFTFNPQRVGEAFHIDLMAGLIALLITTPLSVGLVWFYLRIHDQERVEIMQVFDGFKKYGRVLATSLLVGIFTFLWSLLFIIPGIIKSISYSQAIYLIKEYPELSPLEATKESKERMEGYKGRYAKTVLSFIGWVLVPIICFIISLVFFVQASLDMAGLTAQTGSFVPGDLTMLVGMIVPLIIMGLYLFAISFYLHPYFSTTMAGFYRELAKEKEMIGGVLE